MKNNKTTRYKKYTLTGLKNIKKKVDFMEFKNHYMLNKNGEWVKRSFGGNHRPSGKNNRAKAKMKLYK